MQSPTIHEPVPATSPPPAPTLTEITGPDFSGTPRSIEEFAVRTDFPQCALGVYVDIRGFAGVVVEIVNQSIKVRSSEGITQRFNSYRLRTLCAPPDRSEPATTMRNLDPAEPLEQPRTYIAAPDFSAPVRPINEYASRADFPGCAYGKHIDVLGYAGVVVEIVKGSLKIQSPAGATRSYNGSTLKKLYGRA
jgi:hypothetical protein